MTATDLLALEREYWKLWKALAEDAPDEVHERLCAVEEQIRATPARTLAELAAKARIVWNNRGIVNEDGTALARDVLAFAGVEVRS